jgi:hypothetical protein
MFHIRPFCEWRPLAFRVGPACRERSRSRLRHRSRRPQWCSPVALHGGNFAIEKSEATIWLCAKKYVRKSICANGEATLETPGHDSGPCFSGTESNRSAAPKTVSSHDSGVPGPGCRERSRKRVSVLQASIAPKDDDGIGVPDAHVPALSMEWERAHPVAFGAPDAGNVWSLAVAFGPGAFERPKAQ